MTAKGFLSIGSELHVDFSHPGVIELSGRNGAGKTSIIEAAAWCLFGNKDRDQIINDNHSSATVTVNVLKDSEHIEITRVAKRTKTGMSNSLSFSVDGEKKTDGLTSKEKNSKLNSFLEPLTPESFSAFFRHEQNGTFEFFTATPLNRHRMLTSIHPGLAGWTQLHNNVKKRKKELDTALVKSVSSIDEVKSILDETTCSLKDERSKWGFDPVKAALTLSPEDRFTPSPRALIDAHNDSSAEIEGLKNKIAANEKRTRALSVHLSQSNEDMALARDVSALTKDFMAVVGVDAVNDSSLLTTAEDGKCVTCGHLVDNPEHTIECVNTRVKARELLSEFYLPGIKNFITTSKTVNTKLRETIDELERETTEAQKRVDSLSENILSDYELESLEKSSGDTNDQDDVAIISAAGKIKRLAEEENRLGERLDKLVEKKDAIADRLAVINDIFSKTRESGIPATIAADFAGYLEMVHNGLLQNEFASPGVKVSYGSSSGDEISISASFNGDDMRPILALSGGERALIVVSGAFAMAEAAKKIGIDMGTVFLDEPFHGLDKDNIVKVSDGVSECTGENGVVKTAILVSHSDYTTNSADMTYRIIRNVRGYTELSSEAQ